MNVNLETDLGTILAWEDAFSIAENRVTAAGSIAFANPFNPLQNGQGEENRWNFLLWGGRGLDCLGQQAA